MTNRCEECGTEYEAARSSSRFCSTRCRVAAHRRRTAPTLDDSTPITAGSLEAMAANPLTAPWVPTVAASLDDQVKQAVVEGLALAGAFDRLGRTAKEGLAWRCEKVGDALRQAIKEHFGGPL